MGWIPFLIPLITMQHHKTSNLEFVVVYYFPNSVHTSVTFMCTMTDTPLLSLIHATLHFNASAPSFLFPRHLLTSKRVKTHADVVLMCRMCAPPSSCGLGYICVPPPSQALHRGVFVVLPSRECVSSRWQLPKVLNTLLREHCSLAAFVLHFYGAP